MQDVGDPQPHDVQGWDELLDKTADSEQRGFTNNRDDLSPVGDTPSVAPVIRRPFSSGAANLLHRLQRQSGRCR